MARDEEKQACLSVCERVAGLGRVSTVVWTTATTTTMTTTRTMATNGRKDEVETAIQCGVERLSGEGGWKGG